jgi:hypothetical protein
MHRPAPHLRPNYYRTIPLLVLFVLALVFIKDFAVKNGYLPDRRYAVPIFTVAVLSSYVFHEFVKQGLYPWFAQRTKDR